MREKAIGAEIIPVGEGSGKVMTREHERLLEDLMPKIDGMMFDFMMDNRKRTIGKDEFRKRYRKYSKQMSRMPQEKLPLVMLVQRVNQANDLIGYTKSLARRKNHFSVDPVPIDGSITKNALNDFERPIREVLVPMLSGRASLLSSKDKSRQLPYSEVRKVILPHVFLSIWTALEAYLQDRIRGRVFSSDEAFSSFVERMKVRKLPDTWRESGKPVMAADLHGRMPELIGQLLQAYFGNLRKNGNTETLYRMCFDIRISKYPKIGRLRRVSNLRNTVVHEGTTWFDLSIIQFEYSWLVKFQLLVLDFVEWIEEEIQKSDSRRMSNSRKSE